MLPAYTVRTAYARNMPLRAVGVPGGRRHSLLTSSFFKTFSCLEFSCLFRAADKVETKAL
jgi:hypothetical protein